MNVDRFPKTRLRLFAALVAFHLALALVMSLVARSPLLSDYHNGRGLWDFAADSAGYHDLAASQSALLKQKGFSAWWRVPSVNHSKAISLVYYLTTADPLSIALFNALAWALSVVCVYYIARELEAGNDKYAAIIALVFGLWPSNLLLSTQLMRDIYFNLGCLLFIAGWLGLLSGKRSVGYGALAVLGVEFARLLRAEPYPFFLLIFLIAAVLTVWRSPRSAALAALTLLAPFLLHFAYGKIIPSFERMTVSSPVIEKKVKPKRPPSAPEQKMQGENEPKRWVYDPKKVERVRQEVIAITGVDNAELDEVVKKWFALKWYSPWKKFAVKRRVLLALAEVHGPEFLAFMRAWMTPYRRLDWMPAGMTAKIIHAINYRDAFLSFYLQPGDSMIDRDVVFRSFGDIVRYVPRAAQVGLFAPFPNQWFTRGLTGGGAVRAFAGIETMGWYVLMALFVYFLIVSPVPLHIKIWLVSFTVIMTITLGVFVPNIGTLYRMRFVYLAPVLIGGLDGARLALARRAPMAG